MYGNRRREFLQQEIPFWIFISCCYVTLLMQHLLHRCTLFRSLDCITCIAAASISPPSPPLPVSPPDHISSGRISSGCISSGSYLLRSYLLLLSGCISCSGSSVIRVHKHRHHPLPLFSNNSIIMQYSLHCSLFVIQIAFTADDLKNLFTACQLPLQTEYNPDHHKGTCEVQLHCSQDQSEQ